MLYDQSFNKVTLTRVLRKGDFRGVPLADRDEFKKEILEKACALAYELTPSLGPLCTKFHLKKKPAYKASSLPLELVFRKLTCNLKYSFGYLHPNRTRVVNNLYHHLEEGVPYRVYRLDVKSFYESLDVDTILKIIRNNEYLSPISKKIFFNLMSDFISIGGEGVPRGMVISAAISEILMKEFDYRVSHDESVFFCYCYELSRKSEEISKKYFLVAAR